MIKVVEEITGKRMVLSVCNLKQYSRSNLNSKNSNFANSKLLKISHSLFHDHVSGLSNELFGTFWGGLVLEPIRAQCMLIPRSSIRRPSQTKFVWKKVKFRLFYYFLELVGHRKDVSHSELPWHLCISKIVDSILSKSVPKIYFTLGKIEICHFTFFIKCLWKAGLKLVSKPAPFLWLRASFWIEKNFFTYRDNFPVTN